MATLQATIPFKSRKKTQLNSSKGKSGLENVDILNIGSLTNKKRTKEDSCTSDDEESCSPTKRSRKIAEESMKSDLRNNSSAVKDAPKPLPSREKEIEWLENFLVDHLDKEESASLYISGQPGTGKTACLTYILNLPKIQDGFKQVFVNCTMMKSAASIYSRICKELQLKTTGSSEKACLSAIENYLSKKHKMTLLVLDEIDQLDSKKQSVLYTLFSWGARAGSRVVLVGVANALDLTQRALPRLQARRDLRPQTLHFPPYTKQQIIHIFTTILTAEDKSNVFSPVALQMLAAKIAAVSGDMRRALDIGRRVIELAKRSNFSENKSVDSLLNQSTVTVELKQVLQVLNDVYGGSARIEADVDQAFPMQQKLILCTLMLMLTKGKNRDITLGKLHDVYKGVATSRNIAPLELGELTSACSLLEARGALQVGGGGGRAAAGGARGRRVRLRWDEGELRAALQDKPLLAAILADHK